MRQQGDQPPWEKMSAVAVEDEEEESVEVKAEQGTGEYECSGILEQDFPELCTRAGITVVPKVTLRPPPSFPADEDETTEPTLEDVLTRIERKYGYYKPCIQVEREQEDPRRVRAVFLRGWKVEEPMLGVLSRCLPALGSLQALHLWKVGLTEQQLPALAALLARCPGLRTLSLEGNPLSEPAFHSLLGSDSRLLHLSLRHNSIGAAGARLIGQSLSSNRCLVSLGLSFNHISDLGAGYIAEGLRLNRSLLSLSLTSNDIGDAGATRLAEVLAPFPLTHAEVVQRRWLLLAEALKQPHATPKETKGHGEHPTSLHDKPQPTKHGRNPNKKKESLVKEEIKHLKKREGVPEPRLSRSREIKVSSQEKPNPEAPAPATSPHPLLQEASQHQGSIILPGNRVLRHLNLSHNRITQRGLGAFVAALEAQQREKPKVPGQQGLLGLLLEGNRIPPTSPASARLRALVPLSEPGASARSHQEEEESGSGA
ncbi:leucine-rich repeat-containing protein 71 [Phaenicophaeus curvirostris]|uniref:leucine-rich repeat-containing protein 71 n=1 Tax=Phaenicophaeus curvirostris TaxID=33595 RepID=UPI0037F0CB34